MISDQVHGYCDPAFGLVKEAFHNNFVEHGDLDVAYSIYVGTYKAADLWGAHRDRTAT